MNRKVNNIIFDLAITGHHSEYISHLINYIVLKKIQDKYHFVVSEELKIKFPELIQNAKGCSKIEWEFIPTKKVKDIHGKSLIKRSFAEFSLVEKYAKKLSAKHVYLLYFNIFQIALIFKRPLFEISGILFLQFYRMPKVGFKNRIKYYRKYMTTKLYTYNKKIKNVFVLNDVKTVSFLNQEFKTNIFKVLPDPIPIIKPITDFDIYKHYNIDVKRKIFLHIGSLGGRKGTFEIIDSIKYLSKEVQTKIVVLLVGKGESLATEKLILDKIKQLNTNSSANVIFDNQFVSNDLMKSLFDQVYAVLIPYKNAEASSGILGHAASSCKPVLTTNKGLIKEITKKYNLGVLVDDVTPKEIARKLEELIDYKVQPKKNLKQFVDEHHPYLFSGKIL